MPEERLVGDWTVRIDPHPTLDLGLFTVELELSQPSPDWLCALLEPDAPAPLARSEAIRTDVRDMLREGGYKPTGRGKPASEYLVKAAEKGKLSTINPLVDANNATSLHSGLPVSVVDLDRVTAPLRVGLADAGASYVFNASGQTIDVSGLLCLHDAEGPCANAVKDSQRTKTHPGTTRALALVWGCRAHADQTAAATSWFQALIVRAGGVTQPASE